MRDGVKERYCQSSDKLFFGIPEQMMLDSAGRIVFIAKIGAEIFTGPRGLFRCDRGTVERLAYFSRGSEDVKEGFPDPFPNQPCFFAAPQPLNSGSIAAQARAQRPEKPAFVTVACGS